MSVHVYLFIMAELSGRQPSNLSRPLKTFERYGFVEMVVGTLST